MFLKNYSLLPDYMDSKDIALKIEKILKVSTNSDISTVDIAQALLEIIHLQDSQFLGCFILGFVQSNKCNNCQLRPVTFQKVINS